MRIAIIIEHSGSAIIQPINGQREVINVLNYQHLLHQRGYYLFFINLANIKAGFKVPKPSA